MINSQFKGVIFDLDGTLADTKLDFTSICQEIGLPLGTPLLEHCAQLEDKNKVNNIMNVIEQHELHGAKQAKWIDGAEEMLNQLFNAKIPMAIVTRNMKQAAQITIEKLGIPIQQLVTREDCRPKPDPEGLLLVSNHWNIKASQLIYVGDYKFDLIAAKNAGMSGFLKMNGKNKQFSYLADKLIYQFDELTKLLIKQS